MGIRPAIILINVDLPQPLGPKIDTIWLFGRSRSKFSYSGLPAKYFVRSRMVMCVPSGPGTKGASGSMTAPTGRMLSPAPVHHFFLDQKKEDVEKVPEDSSREDRRIHAADVQHLLRVDDAVTETVVGADEHFGD